MPNKERISEIKHALIDKLVDVRLKSAWTFADILLEPIMDTLLAAESVVFFIKHDKVYVDYGYDVINLIPGCRINIKLGMVFIICEAEYRYYNKTVIDNIADNSIVFRASTITDLQIRLMRCGASLRDLHNLEASASIGEIDPDHNYQLFVKDNKCHMVLPNKTIPIFPSYNCEIIVDKLSITDIKYDNITTTGKIKLTKDA